MATGMSCREIEDDIKKMIWTLHNPPPPTTQSFSPQGKEKASKPRKRTRKKKSPQLNIHPDPSPPQNSGILKEAVAISSDVEVNVTGKTSSGKGSHSNTPKTPAIPQSPVKPLMDIRLPPTAASPSNSSSSAALAELEKDLIFPLKRKSKQFPNAVFYCHLCDYHLDNIAISFKHSSDTRHSRLKRIRDTEQMLKDLPCPTPSHTKLLSVVLDQVYKNEACTEEEMVERKKAVLQLQTKLREFLPDIELNVFGSTQSGFARKTSDINVDVTNAESPKVLIDIKNILQADESEGYTDLYTDFQAKVPYIAFKISCLSVLGGFSGVWCKICCNNLTACLTSNLLATYSCLNPNVRKLCVLFRYWGALCKADSQELGTLPAYVYFLMVIYFFQQRQDSLLPVLHEEGDPKERKGGIPKTENSYLDSADLIKAMMKENFPDTGEDIGMLFIMLLRFYSIEFQTPKFVISIRRYALMGREEKKWSSRNLAVEDPFMRKRNVARALSHVHVFEYIYERLRASYLYFGVPQTRKGPLFSQYDEEQYSKLVEPMNEMLGNEEGDIENVILDSPSPTAVPDEKLNSITDTVSSDKLEAAPNSALSLNDLAMVLSEEVVDHAINTVSNTCLDTKNVVDSGEAQSGHTCEVVEKDESVPTPNGICDKVSVEDSDWQNRYPGVELRKDIQKTIAFTFERKNILGDSKGPAIMCSVCQKEGHLKKNCPEESLPELQPLPPHNTEYVQLLSYILSQVPHDFEPMPQEIMMRQQVLNDIESFIQENFCPSASLKLFGSSVNGFGFSHSDLDICMTIDGVKQDEVDYVETIKVLGKALKNHRFLGNVVPITTAKVPIVKFKHLPSQLEGDISLFNTLAQHNTAMLQFYSQIDPRVKAIGYTMKVFAKLCDICDASRGSISSYAYVLMVIYYLQQRNPPVLPVLQELHTGEKPELIVDDWNAWFFRDLEALPKKWPHWGANTESLGELWIGLLRFYTEEFKFHENVVCIRQHEALTRFEKLWNGKTIAIEDPFDLNHNLGGGLSRKMNTFIMTAFRNGRLLFGTPVLQIPPTFDTIQDYLFDPQLLTNGTQPPNDRGCRICGKIGHYAKDCPIVKARKNRKDIERREKEERKGTAHVPNGQLHSDGTESQHNNDHDSSSLSSSPHQNKMARGQQKIQAQQKNAEKQAKIKKAKSGDNAKSGAAALKHVCTVCKSQMPDPKTYKQHFENKHPKAPLPAELKDI